MAKRKFLAKFISRKAYPFSVLAVLILAMLVAGGIAFYYYSKLSRLAGDSAYQTEAETAALLSKVSKLIVLPQDEEPTIATVSDAQLLRDQPFFAKAQAGFKVLIYTKARKAILYDPVADKIVEVAPINIGGGATANPSQ